jgi:hypothetical protein
MVLPIIVAITLSLNKYTFGCTDVGVNTVIPTVTDSQGNTATCATKIRVDALPLIVEHLEAIMCKQKQMPPIIEITACPVDSAGNTIKQDVTLELTGIDPSLNDKINRWENLSMVG